MTNVIMDNLFMRVAVAPVAISVAIAFYVTALGFRGAAFVAEQAASCLVMLLGFRRAAFVAEQAASSLVMLLGVVALVFGVLSIESMCLTLRTDEAKDVRDSFYNVALRKPM